MIVSFRIICSSVCVLLTFILEFRECEAEIDTQWSIKWNKTSPKNYDVQTCPGEFPIGLFCKYFNCSHVNMLSVAGMSFRLCEYGGIWQQPNVSNCATKRFVDIKNMVMYNILLLQIDL